MERFIWLRWSWVTLSSRCLLRCWRIMMCVTDPEIIIGWDSSVNLLSHTIAIPSFAQMVYIVVIAWMFLSDMFVSYNFPHLSGRWTFYSAWTCWSDIVAALTCTKMCCELWGGRDQRRQVRWLGFLLILNIVLVCDSCFVKIEEIVWVFRFIK